MRNFKGHFGELSLLSMTMKTPTTFTLSNILSSSCFSKERHPPQIWVITDTSIRTTPLDRIVPLPLTVPLAEQQAPEKDPPTRPEQVWTRISRAHLQAIIRSKACPAAGADTTRRHPKAFGNRDGMHTMTWQALAGIIMGTHTAQAPLPATHSCGTRPSSGHTNHGMPNLRGKNMHRKAKGGRRTLIHGG